MKIAVIGAGIAGLVAARELQALGHRVDLFEKSRGRGGRLATRRLDWGAMDIGAQYFTAREPAFLHQVEAWCNAGVAAPWTFTPYRVDGTSLLPSPDEIPRFVGTPAMNSVAHQLSEGLTIEFNLRIKSLSRQGGDWYLLDQAQSQHGPYNWVILAIPPVQAVDLLAHEITLEAAQQHNLMPCWALVLSSQGEVSPEIQGIFGDETISWVSRLSARPGRSKPVDSDDLWLLHFSSEWSTIHEKMPHAHIVEQGESWLSRVLDRDLHIRQEHLHFWRYAKLANPGEGPGPLVSSDEGLALIGDWCNGGRVEGAYMSALTLVESHFR